MILTGVKHLDLTQFCPLSTYSWCRETNGEDSRQGRLMMHMLSSSKRTVDFLEIWVW
ncbi:hypothetical protein Plhal304r1_c037g0112551 [Plasmopara halstedii]